MHFSLLVNAMMGRWLPPAYLFYNVLFMVALMWAIHSRESVDAIHTVSYFWNIFSDIILKSIFFKDCSYKLRVLLL